MFSDQSIGSSKNDLFGRKHFAQRIAGIIASRTAKEGIVLGIHAPWGEGKTSVLDMITESLTEHLHKKGKTLLNGNIVLLKFNPWQFFDENKMLENFFAALADKVEGRIETKTEKLADVVRKYSWVAAPLDAVKIGFLGAEASIKAEETLKKVAEAKPKADITELKERIEKILEKTDKKIVIIMDDIDRLDKDEIQAIFRLVKLSADFPNTIYILSFDVERVSEALADKYGSKEAGRSFLEKIIQLSLPLPPLTPNKLIRLTFDKINELLAENQIELPQNEDADWSYFFMTKFGPYLKTPRLIKKYINNLWFLLPEVKNELNILDLQTIEAIHTFFPDLYHIIRSNKEVFLLEPSSPYLLRDDEEKKHLERLKKIVESFPELQRESIKAIIQKLFPRTSGAFSNTHHGTSFYDRWTREKRIAAPKYFQRYFDVGVSDDDISDTALQDFVDGLPARSNEQNIDEIKKLISQNRAELFLEKISLYIDNLAEVAAMNLAKALAISGGLFPRGSNESRIFGLDQFSLAARLLRHLLETITNEKHCLEAAIEIASIAAPLDFAYEYFRFAQYIGQEKDENKLTKLGKAIINKIVERAEIEAKKDGLEKLYPQSSANLYRAWLNEKPKGVKKYLKERFANNPKEAEEFVISFRRQSWDVNGIARFWGFDFIVQALEESNPNIELIQLESNTPDSTYRLDDDGQYLDYFVSIAKMNASQTRT